MTFFNTFVLALCLAALPSFAQSASITVRLYSRHSERSLKLHAESGNLTWRLCERCEPGHAKELSMEATGDQLRIQGEPAIQTNSSQQVFVEGTYRLEPEHGLKVAASFPLHMKAEHGLLSVLGTMPPESYVMAAVEGESATFHQPESLKAMAIAVRTYAVHFKPRHQGYDFCDNTHCQNLNFTGATPQVRAAVEATRNELLWYKGSAAATYYHQHCGGMIADGREVWPDLQAPYLRRHEDQFCRRASPLLWKAELSRSELEQALHEQGLTVPTSWTQLEVASRSPSGRALRLRFRTLSGPPQLISASSLRFAIGRSRGWNQVRSDLYEVETTGSAVIFTGHGAGHGVGLCQGGAEEMAKEGKSYREILAFYYPGTSLGVAAQGLLWEKLSGKSIELLSTQLAQDASMLPIAEGILNPLSKEFGWKLASKIQLKIYPSLDAYRDSTGQPGWIAAFTHGQIIHLQPVATLKNKSILESTLRHEFLHLFVEARAHAGTPLWFREGLVLYLSNPAEHLRPEAMSEADMETALQRPKSRLSLERAYAAARTRIVQLVDQNGRETVLLWLGNGLPAGFRSAQP